MLARGIFLALSASPIVEAAHWAVIAAGSRGYSNYRHQADACHAYQLMRKKGIPEDHIIMMAYDDIATAEENPFQGAIFNAPDPNGTGNNVYDGCNIDYRRQDVTVDNFKAILTGNSNGLNSNASKKVLKSTADDYVFLYFVDHGAPGLVAFPDTEMHAKDLQQTFAQMHSKGMYKSLLMYLETCESGSMFQDLNVTGVYAVSAANPTESSWGTFCMNEDVINGTSLHTCLGDLFSVNWISNAERNDLTKETLESQYESVMQLTNKSHVMQWGDKSVASEVVANFFGNQAGILETGRWGFVPRNLVKATEIALHRLYEKYNAMESALDRLLVAKQMEEQIREQSEVEKAFVFLAQIAYPGDSSAQHQARKLKHKPANPDCELAGHAAIREHCDKFDANSGFALHYHQVVVNICADIREKGLNLDIRGASMQACGKMPTSDATVVV